MSIKGQLANLLVAVDTAVSGSDTPIWSGKVPPPDGRSEAVLFIKPEVVTAGSSAISGFVDLVDSKLAEFGVEVVAVGTLGWKYLDHYNLIGEHYGVINQISTEGVRALTEESQSLLRAAFPEATRVLGGHQFLAEFPEFTPATLSVLWDNLNSHSKRIAPGCYAMSVQVLSEHVVILNGFNPYQLLHFTAPGRAIIVAIVRTDASWQALREELIGATDPTLAAAGSLRAELLRRAAEFGIPVVNKGLNGIHLSAGPLEGMVEVIRFASRPDRGEATPILSTNFGTAIAAVMSEEAARALASNPKVSVEGRSMSAFDATEGLSPPDAIRILSSFNPD